MAKNIKEVATGVAMSVLAAVNYATAVKAGDLQAEVQRQYSSSMEFTQKELERHAAEIIKNKDHTITGY